MRKRKYRTTDEFMKAAVEKQLEMAGLPTDLYLKEENWYTNTISYDKYVEFKEWWLKEAQEQYRYTKAYTLKAWGWFDVAYGLRVPIQQGNEDV
jgi:hypothetical protein